MKDFNGNEWDTVIGKSTVQYLLSFYLRYLLEDDLMDVRRSTFDMLKEFIYGRDDLAEYFSDEDIKEAWMIQIDQMANDGTILASRFDVINDNGQSSGAATIVQDLIIAESCKAIRKL